MADTHDRELPVGSLRITTGCQYCAVGCGYSALLVPVGVDLHDTETFPEASGFITPAMRGRIRYRGSSFDAAVVPDVRCRLNRGNHSVRGGSVGSNLVSHDGSGRSTRDRLTTPAVRRADGELQPISWQMLNALMARLLSETTQLQARDGRISVGHPERLGVKLFEYQFLENTYAATKLFYSLFGTPNVAFHDRPSAAGSSPGLADTGFSPHDFAYKDVRDQSDLIFVVGANPYENQSVFWMNYCSGKRAIVLDPRRTATAQDAVDAGGLHLQPTRLGADSLVLHAMAREIIRRWLDFDDSRALTDFPLRPGIHAAAASLPVLAAEDAGGGLSRAKLPAARRRASRALGFLEFARDFLRVDDPDSPYTLARASQASGIDPDRLGEAVDLLFDASQERLSQQPKVAILYEKGLIWGFNYHNTAAVGTLGLLTGAYLERGRLVGRVGGHQKGWAEARTSLAFVEGSSDEGYPWRTATDRYSDRYLERLRDVRPGVEEDWIQVKHNLDNHVFGPPEGRIVGAPSKGRVRLDNGLVTAREPEVRLLWMIGTNYLGQTNDAAAKRSKLQARLEVGGAPGRPLRVEASDSELTVEDIAAPLLRRIGKGGLVLVHQEVMPNPTTELCDLVIPAAGWGEDDFIRYNAQRRLKLYARFQDPPLDPGDRARIADQGEPDPLAHRANPEVWRHSPKPDWMILRDVARALGNELGDETLQAALEAAFRWTQSAQVADEMAELSNRRGLLGDLLSYGVAHGIAPGSGILHRVLGSKRAGEAADGLAPLLGTDAQGLPLYYVPGADEESGTAVANNGVLLPVRHVRSRDGVDRLEGTLAVEPAPGFAFIAAPWHEVQPAFVDHLPRGEELFVTNGRVNHLWNNLFHHLRNDYVNERYPEDLPGTILELNPGWAARQGIQSGQLVEVTAVSGASFTAVASLQASVPVEGAFAVFSYPVREPVDGRLVAGFQGYANNVTSGYSDGIHPIAALKYGRAHVRPRAPVAFYSSPRLDHPDVRPRLGPTYEPRNRVRPRPSDTPATPEAQMLELIESLRTRAAAVAAHAGVIVTGETTLADLFAGQDNGSEILAFLRDGSVRGRKLVVAGQPESSYLWELVDEGGPMAAAFGSRREVVRKWIAGLAADDGDPEARMLALIERFAAGAQRTHNFVQVGGGQSLQELFREGRYRRILNFLRDGSVEDQKLVVAGDPEASYFWKLVNTGGPMSFFEATDRDVVKNWILSLAA